MSPGRDIRLQEDDDGWRAVEENSGLTGRGESAQEALAVLEARLETRGEEVDSETTDTTPASGDSGETAATEEEWDHTTASGDDPGLVDIEGLRMTISPKVELVFGGAAVAAGGLYLLVGNTAGSILVAIGVMLLVRVVWIEYGLFGQ